MDSRKLSTQRLTRALRSLLLLIAGVAAAAAAHSSSAPAPVQVRDEAFVPSPEMARLMSLGFESAVAKLFWLEAVQVVGAEKQDPYRHAPYLARLLDVVTSLDPWSGHPYRFAAVWLTDSPERVRFANTLLERGIAHHPDDWRNYFHLGFNLFFYLDDYAAAADALEPAVHLDGPPTYLKRLVARLRANSGALDNAAAFLKELAQGAEDEHAARQYRRALKEVETERRARILDTAREMYQERNGRDITAVEDLLRGPRPVLMKLPPLPQKQASWVIDEDTGRIVSSHYGRRYEPHLAQARRERDDEWEARRRARATQGDGE